MKTLLDFNPIVIQPLIRIELIPLNLVIVILFVYSQSNEKIFLLPHQSQPGFFPGVYAIAFYYSHHFPISQTGQVQIFISNK